MTTTVSSTHRLMLICLGILLATLAQPAYAQKQKSTDLAGFPLLWSAKKNPLAGPFVPGLNAALLLSEEQKERLVTAREETLGNEKIQALGLKVKLNPQASDAEREAAQKAQAEARDQFKARVAGILTPAQRKLVDTINGLYDDALVAAQDEYRGQLEQVVKTDKAKQAELRHEVQQKAAKNFRARLEGTLSKDQWSALTKAAETEESMAKNPVKVKKP